MQDPKPRPKSKPKARAQIQAQSQAPKPGPKSRPKAKPQSQGPNPGPKPGPKSRPKARAQSQGPKPGYNLTRPWRQYKGSCTADNSLYTAIPSVHRRFASICSTKSLMEALWKPLARFWMCTHQLGGRMLQTLTRDQLSGKGKNSAVVMV